MNRRMFMAVAASGAAKFAAAQDAPDAIKKLRPMLDGVQPISHAERRARIAKAQRLMQENKIDAIVLEGGSSMFYFSGARWNAGGRTFVLVIPAKGQLGWVVDHADEARANDAIHHDLVSTAVDVRIARDEEDAFKKIAQLLKDRGARRIGVEERVRFGVYDAIRKQAPSLEF